MSKTLTFPIIPRRKIPTNPTTNILRKFQMDNLDSRHKNTVLLPPEAHDHQCKMIMKEKQP